MNKKIITNLNLFLIAVSLVLLTISFISLDVLSYQLVVLCQIILSIISGLYIVFDYSKEGAKYYKAFFIFYAVTFIVETACFFSNTFNFSMTNPTITLVLDFVLFGNIVLLGFGKDLGKALSFGLSSINLIVYGVNIITYLFVGPIVFVETVVYLTWLFISLIAFVMVNEKYKDKENRLTK